MKPKRAGRSLRSRIFIAFLGALLPVLVLLIAAVELLLVPYLEARTWKELTSSTRVLTSAVRASASMAIRNHLEAIAERNREIARHHLELVEQNVLSRTEAITRLRYILLSQQVGTSGYIYCINSRGTAVVHPSPAVQGTDNSGFAFVREQMERREGYMEYDWQNPGEDFPRKKALYMVYLEPLDWIISASCYHSELNELLNPKDFRDTVLSLRFGESGYSYVFNQEGQTLIHPVFKDFNALSQPDVPSDFVRNMLTTGSGRLTYDWRNPDETALRRKMAVYESLPEYGWVIVSSAYVDEVMKPVQIARGISYGGLLLLLMAAGATAYLLSGRLTRPVDEMVRQLDRNARNSTREPLPTPVDGELGRLAREFNLFLATIDRQNDELRRERARYRSLFEASPDAILLLRKQTIIDCNPTTFTMFSGDAESIIGRSIPDLSPPVQPSGESSAAMAERMGKISRNTPLQTFEWVHQALNGRRFDAEVRLKPFDKTEDEVLLVAFVRDITKRKRAERSLRQERDFSRALIDATPAYIVILDLEGRIRLINPAFCRILGCTEEEVIGTDYFDLAIPAQDRTRIRAVMTTLIEAADRGETVTRTGANPVLTCENRERLVQWSTSWLSDLRSEGQTVLAVGVDVTEERMLQDQLHHAQKLEALGRLAGGVAHDFNNMLGGIMGAAELLKIQLGSDEALRSRVTFIIETVERAADLAGRLLTFSRKDRIVSIPMDLHRLLQDAFRIFRSGLQQDIKAEIDLLAADMTIIGDPSQLQNVFLNLFINARDAMPEGGKLRIATRNAMLDDRACTASAFELAPGLYTEIIVSDTGIGIDETTRSKIFEPFFTTKEEGRGTGLGLASAYGTIKHHRGEICVESTPGEGTTFILRLPCAGAAAAASRPDDTCRPCRENQCDDSIQQHRKPAGPERRTPS